MLSASALRRLGDALVRAVEGRALAPEDDEGHDSASRLVPGKFSQMPVRPSGQSAATRSMGNTSAVDTEMSEALSGFPTASI